MPQSEGLSSSRDHRKVLLSDTLPKEQQPREHLLPTTAAWAASLLDALIGTFGSKGLGGSSNHGKVLLSAVLPQEVAAPKEPSSPLPGQLHG